MSKFLQSMGLLYSMEELLPYEKLELKFGTKEAEFFSKLIGRYSMIIQPELDEAEVAEIINDYLKTKHLDIINIHELSAMIQSTIYDKTKDILQ